MAHYISGLDQLAPLFWACGEGRTSWQEHLVRQRCSPMTARKQSERRGLGPKIYLKHTLKNLIACKWATPLKDHTLFSIVIQAAAKLSPDFSFWSGGGHLISSHNIPQPPLLQVSLCHSAFPYMSLTHLGSSCNWSPAVFVFWGPASFTQHDMLMEISLGPR